MATYLYRIRNGAEYISAHESKNYASAREDALHYFGKLILDSSHRNHAQWKDLSLQLSDENGLVLLCLDFVAVESPAVNRRD